MMEQVPRTPLMLGLAGLLPFWGLATARISGWSAVDPSSIDFALATYAAIIISFLGGIRWGLATATRASGEAHFFVSVLPSLVAWALLAAPEPWRLAGLGVVAFVLGPLDAFMVSSGLAPRWLGRLRLMLSTGAGIALLLGAFG